MKRVGEREHNPGGDAKCRLIIWNYQSENWKRENYLILPSPMLKNMYYALQWTMI